MEEQEGVENLVVGWGGVGRRRGVVIWGNLGEFDDLCGDSLPSFCKTQNCVKGKKTPNWSFFSTNQE